MLHIIERGRRIFVGVAIVLASALTLSIAQAPPANATVGLRNEMFRATNSSRSAHDKHGLDLDAKLSAKARRHSIAMANADVLFHTSDVSVYLRGVSWSRWGENVGRTTEDISTLQKAFMHSKDHRTNILNGGFTHVAIGAVRRDGTLWVTVFFYG